MAGGGIGGGGGKRSQSGRAEEQQMGGEGRHDVTSPYAAPDSRPKQAALIDRVKVSVPWS